MVARARRQNQAKYLLKKGAKAEEVSRVCGVSFYWAKLMERKFKGGI